MDFERKLKHLSIVYINNGKITNRSVLLALKSMRLLDWKQRISLLVLKVNPKVQQWVCSNIIHTLYEWTPS